MTSSTAHGVELLDPAALDAAATAAGQPCHRAETAAISSRAGFFDIVRDAFPTDPPLLGQHSWDALSDSLFGGLLAAPGDRAVLVLTDLTLLRERAPEEFDTALAVLADVADTLADPVATAGRPVALRCLVGLHPASS
ncbi:barstar family protein [Kitasatospora cineracea]